MRIFTVDTPALLLRRLAFATTLPLRLRVHVTAAEGGNPLAVYRFFAPAFTFAGPETEGTAATV